MLLTDDQEMIRDAVRQFAQEQIWPNAAKWDKEHHFPRDVHQGLAQLGAYGICVPEEHGGAGMNYLSLALVLEEIAAGDGGTSTVISVTNCPVNAILMKYGNAAQKKQWLEPLARGEMLGAFLSLARARRPSSFTRVLRLFLLCWTVIGPAAARLASSAVAGVRLGSR